MWNEVAGRKETPVFVFPLHANSFACGYMARVLHLFCLQDVGFCVPGVGRERRREEGSGDSLGIPAFQVSAVHFSQKYCILFRAKDKGDAITANASARRNTKVIASWSWRLSLLPRRNYGRAPPWRRRPPNFTTPNKEIALSQRQLHGDIKASVKRQFLC